MYNRMEMRLGYSLFPVFAKMKENIGPHLDLYVFPSFPGEDSGQFAQIFNIKVSSFISNVAVVNTPCPTLWRQLFDI